MYAPHRAAIQTTAATTVVIDPHLRRPLNLCEHVPDLLLGEPHPFPPFPPRICCRMSPTPSSCRHDRGLVRAAPLVGIAPAVVASLVCAFALPGPPPVDRSRAHTRGPLPPLASLPPYRCIYYLGQARLQTRTGRCGCCRRGLRPVRSSGCASPLLGPTAPAPPISAACRSLVVGDPPTAGHHTLRLPPASTPHAACCRPLLAAFGCCCRWIQAGCPCWITC